MAKYDLVGQDGNAFFLMGYVGRALRDEGLGHLVGEMREKATQSDYNNLLCVCMEYLDLANEAAYKNGYIDEDDDDDFFYEDDDDDFYEDDDEDTPYL